VLDNNQMTKSYCRLFLATPLQFKLPDIEACLIAAISAGDIASLLIRHEDEAKRNFAANRLTKIAQKADIAVLIENDPHLARACNADGVQVPASLEHFSGARQIIGPDPIIGVDARNNRHNAMALAEAGADYVALDYAPAQGDAQGEPVPNWWARVFEVPCVAATPLDIGTAKTAVAAGVDFITPDPEMWHNEQQAGAAICNYNAMIKDTKIETS
jgi:thiamine-phosphate pyrophosphorylase